MICDPQEPNKETKINKIENKKNYYLVYVVTLYKQIMLYKRII